MRARGTRLLPAHCTSQPARTGAVAAQGIMRHACNAQSTTCNTRHEMTRQQRGGQHATSGRRRQHAKQHTTQTDRTRDSTAGNSLTHFAGEAAKRLGPLASSCQGGRPRRASDGSHAAAPPPPLRRRRRRHHPTELPTTRRRAMPTRRATIHAHTSRGARRCVHGCAGRPSCACTQHRALLLTTARVRRIVCMAWHGPQQKER